MCRIEALSMSAADIARDMEADFFLFLFLELAIIAKTTHMPSRITTTRMIIMAVDKALKAIMKGAQVIIAFLNLTICLEVDRRIPS